MQPARINTRRVVRRTVRLLSLDELVGEIDRIEAAAVQGKLRQLGNWSSGQVFWHLAKFIELSCDGFPFRYRRGPAWVSRLLRFLSWRGLIRLVLRPGFDNPSEAAILEPPEGIEFQAATAYLREQIKRIAAGTPMTQAVSAEGPYAHDQWVYVHLRHAELHLSFLAIEP
jgi:hypothetical protein